MEWPRILTAMVTPFTPSGEVDLDQAGRLAQWLIKHGSGGLVLAGTTGESPTLSPAEREALFYHVRQAVPTTPIWVGTGANDTRQSIAQTRAAESWGADGIMLVAPYYNKPIQDGLFRHFVAIAEQTRLPVMIYNVPGRTGVNVDPSTIFRIVEHAPNVLAVKEAAGSIDQLQQLIAGTPERVKIYTGDDSLYFAALLAGAWGVVSVAAHVAGDGMKAMTESFLAGDKDRAAGISERLAPIFAELFCLSNPIPLKWALNHVGIRVGDLRLPLCFPDDPSVLERLEQLVEAEVAPDAVMDWNRLAEAR